MTDTSNPPDNDSNKPTEEVSPEESADEEQYDDIDYTTASYMDFVKNPPLLPNECEGAFGQLRDDIEFRSSLELKTPMEYFLVAQVCTKRQNLSRYEAMALELMQSQRRPALEDLFMKTEEPTGLDASALKGMAFNNANLWFANPAYRASADKSFEAAGYRPNAIEVEAFRRSLPSLALLERLIASAQKSILTLMKELEKRCRDREAKERDD